MVCRVQRNLRETLFEVRHAGQCWRLVGSGEDALWCDGGDRRYVARFSSDLLSLSLFRCCFLVYVVRIVSGVSGESGESGESGVSG